MSAKNLVQYDNRRFVIKNLSAAVAEGSLARRNGFVGIPNNHAPAGGSVTFALEGCFGLTYPHYAGHPLAALLPKAGTILYWDTSANTLSIGSAADDYALIKCLNDVSSTDGTFQGMLLPQTKPVGQDQS